MPAPPATRAPAAGRPSPALVPQLLMAYSERFNARTIREHVEHLRRHGYVWWGRFSTDSDRFDEAAARARWPHVARLAGERAAAKEPSLLFVTNHHDLHVLEVTRVVFGDDPTGRVRAEALRYYEEQSVPIWFRVEDSRALSYDRATTSDWFHQRLGVVKGGATRWNGSAHARPFDNCASVLYEYPVVVEGPSAGELFDAASLPAGAKRWADARDAISSRPVQRAHETLETLLLPGLWHRLHVESRESLANAWVEKGHIEHDDDVDPSMAFSRIAIAIEIVVREELFPAIEALRDRAKAAGSPLGGALEDVLDGARPRDSSAHVVPWSLGPSLAVFRKLASHHRRALDQAGLASLVTLCTDLKWLERTKKLRDPAVHGGDAEMKAARKRAMVEFFGERGKRVGPVLDARDAVGAWGVG